MISLFVFVISFIVASIIFFIKDKRISGVLSFLSIVINVYFLFRYGLFYEFYVTNYVGNFGFTVNDLNYPLIITILVVTLVTVYYSQRYMEKRFHELGYGNWGLYYALYSLFAISMFYVVISINLLELYIFLEISLITSFLLILLYGYGDRRRISLLYFIWTHVGTILTLASIVILGLVSGKMDIYSSFGEIYNYSTIAYAPLIFIAGVIGMFIKGAQAGFNIWLPYAHGEAPTPISILLSPNMVGLGIFVVIIYYYLFPSFSFLAPIFIAWAIITMIYGGINALAQRDFKRFLAYSSVSQMGYMLLGASISFFIGLKSSVLTLPLGIIASVLIYASHGFGKALLFMSAGAAITELEERDIEKLGGLYLVSPLHTTLAFIGILNILGLPPTVGLVSEVLLLMSAGQLVPLIGEGFFVLLVALLMIAIGMSSGYATYLFKKVYSNIKERKQSLDNAYEYSIPMIITAIVSVIFFFLPEFMAHSLSNFIQTFSTNSLNLFFIVFLPAIGSLIALIVPMNQDTRGGIVTALIGISMILAIINLINSVHSPLFVPQSITTVFSYFTFSSSLLQALLGVFVSSLAFFISMYSIGYMKEDSVLRRYWGFFGFFVSSMLAVIYADNVLLFLAGWEGTSLASYGLISYWLDDNERNVVGDFGRKVFGIEYLSRPTTSGIRAMIFTRIGDVGLIVGLGYLMYLTTLSDYSGITTIYSGLFSVLHLIYNLPYGWVILLLMFLGGLGKSAQFPLTQWLLTAMTGPTPVSALIHAATMVNLGAILTFFVYPFLVYPNPQTTLFMSIMVGISMFTAIYTSTSALASNEQKLILAYSTADQISLMILSSSIGGLLASLTSNLNYLYAGILIGFIQMLAHGTYKASLFMNAGSVIHFTENRYVGVFKGLYRKLKSVFVLQLLAALNLASIPPLIGFWAHDLIGVLASNTSLFPLYVITEFLGGVYIIRYVIKAFLWKNGEDAEEEGHVHPLMIISPAILVITSIILGAVFLTSLVPFFTSIGLSSSFISLDLPSVLLAILGVIIALALYLNGLDLGKYSGVRPLVDFLYYGWFVNPAFDKFGIAGYRFAKGVYEKFEYGVIDLSLNMRLPQGLIRAGNSIFKKTETGILRDYIFMYLIGLVILAFIIIFFIMGV
ncbi:proton-conducting transporter membrane subunit [Sulfurisphaera tokodaii]|uniref:NADH-quinone oxidoreductase subunit L/M n=2 Tax=Sulfurisphaera tokodaii TaxID=111955 RepID=Q96YE8_SULTO|nr:proton-conducting transporter membrane subunit [Sulfurisphaera tokodaii]BAB67329.1 putative NADH-quinone oxidoreductase subunit L/M [Sulfurisphaera tokodaii str. 7]HII73042.1 oxidoreductase [Sulfurisphaera tokodaii]